MSSKTPSPEEVYAEFHWRRTVNAIILLLLAAFIVAAVFFVFNTSLTIVGLSNQASRYLLVGLGIALFLAEALVWACPVCKRHLGRNPNPKKCPRCGVELRPKK